jgi:hypothetical protein
MTIDWSAVLTGALTAAAGVAVTGVASWAFLKFSNLGQQLWKEWGEGKGVRFVATLAVAALVFAVGALIWLVASRIGPEPQLITISNMGPDGPSDDPNASFYHNWKFTDGDFHDIPKSEGFDLCAVTGFYAGSSSNEWCDLERGGAGQWRLRKTNAIVCRVKCFRLNH